MMPESKTCGHGPIGKSRGTTTTQNDDRIRLTRVVSPNLFEANDSFCLDPGMVRRLAVEPPRAGAVSFVAKRLMPSIAQDALADACSEAFLDFCNDAALLDGYRMLLFASISLWRTTTPEARARELLIEHLGLAPLSAVVGQPQWFASGNGVRYAAVFSVDPQTLAAAVRVCRRDLASFLFLTENKSGHDTGSLDALFAAAFPGGRDGDHATSVNWTHCAIVLSASNMLPVRVSGSLDDPEVGIDLIGGWSILESLLWREELAHPRIEE